MDCGLASAARRDERRVLNIDYIGENVTTSDLKSYFRSLMIFAVAASLIAIATKGPVSLIALALLIGWPLVGTLITIDDDLPGGWSNPDGTSTPEWKTLDWYVDIFLCRASIVALAFAFQDRGEPNLALTYLGAAAAMAVLGFSRLISVARRNDMARPNLQSEYPAVAMKMVEDRINVLRGLSYSQSASLPEADSVGVVIVGKKATLTTFRYLDAHELNGMILLVVSAATPSHLGMTSHHIERGLVFSPEGVVRSATASELQNSGG